MKLNATYWRKRILCSGIATGVVWILLLLTVPGLEAHKVTVFAWVEGNTVHTESKYSGGRKAKNAPISVYDGTGNLLLQGSTDDQGKFSFPIPRKTEMKVVLQAGMGHKAEWILPARELESAGHLPSAATAASDQHPTGSAPMELPDRGDAPAASSLSGGPTAAEIEMAVEQALDRKLQPVMEMLAESRQTGPGIRDIIGGVGYIIGLVGLAAYLRYRRSKKIPDSSGADSEPPTKDI